MTRSVLLVDDEPNIALSLEYRLKREGYDVRVAGDGEEALERIAERRPDLVLLDVMMPRRDGYDVCQTLRRDPAMSEVKIVILTAKGGAIEGEKALALGADAFFPKPFGLGELLARVRQLLGEDTVREGEGADAR
ncbi:MAG: response regulator [Pseudomonadota bacterium]